MNILVYPMYSVDVINSDSNYVIIKNIINNLPEHNWFLIIDKNRKYYKDDLANNCKLIYMSMERSKRRQVVNFQTKVLHRILNDYPIEIILNNAVEFGSNFKYFNTAEDENYQLKVINYHHYNIHPSFGVRNYNSMKNILYAQIFGSLDVDVNYFHSEHSYKMFKDEALKLINKETLDRIKKHTELGGHVDPKYFKTDIPKYELFTFIYNHRLAGYKNYKTTFEQFDKLWAKYPNQFQVIATCGDNSNEAKVIDKPYVKLKSLKNYEIYISELQKCHANVINSSHETYCISIAESIYDNQVIIAPNGVTFPELTGEEYPYLFNNLDEQFKYMENILVNNIRSYQYQKDLTIAHQTAIINGLIQDYCQYKKVLENIRKKDNALALTQIDDPIISLPKFRHILSKMQYAPQSFPTNKVSILLKELGYSYRLDKGYFIKKTIDSFNA